MPLDSSSYEPMPEGHRRLLVLAGFLETKVPPARFNLADWTADRDSIPTLECGTAACACGWAGMIPELNALGFRLVLAPLRPGSRDLAPTPEYGGLMGWAAAIVFFGLNSSTAYRLFDELSYESDPTPHEVAARIRSFVAEHSSARVG